ncbi:hypothetical protein FS749_002116 [Ceratobasidium sp. UAMH 11750]|nr:hypothetical protein FS749_002116 [Ceratobasidium sp. UAMH 11750]
MKLRSSMAITVASLDGQATAKPLNKIQSPSTCAEVRTISDHLEPKPRGRALFPPAQTVTPASKVHWSLSMEAPWCFPGLLNSAINKVAQSYSPDVRCSMN